MPISPNQGSTSGGTIVTITGVNLANATSVKFGSNNATITANTPTSITVTSPSGTGVVNVVVTTNAGSSNFLQFFYILPPFLNTLSSYYGPTAGGNSVVINGYNLATASSVSFDSNTATPTINNDGQITVTVPAGASPGNVNIFVTTTGGNSSSLQYTYLDAPTIDTVTPSSGSINGGNSLTITGTNLVSTSSVTFGGTPGAFGVINSTTISVITPANSAGSVDIVVTTNAGSSTAVEAYTYISGPGI
jgi:hypothetical protein